MKKLSLVLSLGLLLSVSQASRAADVVDLDGPGAVSELANIVGKVRGGPEASTHTILRWSHPPVEGSRYALRGRIAYRGVEGDGYLEMWSHFGSKGSYFSRTLTRDGPLAALRGDAAERAFALPFDMGDSSGKPERIEVNIVLPGEGSVTIRDLRWAALDDPLEHRGAAADGAWWSARHAGIFGGVAGGVLGLLGALVGTLCSTGRARGAVMGALALQGALGVASILAGVCALMRGQPTHVSGVLLGAGFFATGMALWARGVATRHYRDLEFRRMHAFDLRVDAGDPQP